MNGCAPILIVGASAAGVAAARMLRLQAFGGRIVLIDGDSTPPYERPPLSKRMLEDPQCGCGDFPLLTEADAASLGVELRLGRRVASLDPGGLALRMDDGEVMAGGAILLATGGRARRLPLPGADLPGVHVIRTFEDAEAVRGDLAVADSVAVVGGGLIGAEAAVSIARSGRGVTWIDAAERPLAHILPAPIADHLVASHLDAGVALRSSARIVRLLDAGGRVAGVELGDGEIVPAQVVVLGVGMAPDDSLAREAGLEVSQGVHVTADHRTSAPGVFAAGDVAAFLDESSGARRRHEHWRAAEQQGGDAARAMLGLPASAPSISWFWSDQGPHHVEMAGRRTGDTVSRRGSKGVIAFEMDGDRLAGVASVDEPNAVRVGLRLIPTGRRLDRAALADETTDLRSFLKAPA